MQCNCLKYNYLIFRTPLKGIFVEGFYGSLGLSEMGMAGAMR